MKFVFELVILSLMFYVIPMSVVELLAIPPGEGVAQYWINLLNIIVYGAVVSTLFAMLKLIKMED
jgi:hypothetical protein